MTILPPKRHICVTRMGQESFIEQELSYLSEHIKCTDLATGVIELTGVDLTFLAENPILFSCQLLPEAFSVEGNSIKTIASGVVSALIERLSGEIVPWHLHIFDSAAADTGEQYSRARLIHQEILSLLKQKRRSLLKSLSDEPTPEATLVQVLLVSPTCTFMSVTSPTVQDSLRGNITPYRAGYVEIADDKCPPSRAFKKLLEAIKVFNLTPKRGETCVDLGACPGGWTHVMVEQGLTVIAVDRTPLDEPLMRNKRVTFIKGDAFTWLPKEPVTWLICDVITTPDRTLNILDTWLSKRMCASFCVTVKFQGEPDFLALRQIRELLKAKTEWFDGKQLTNNKNELTFVGRVAR